MTADNSFVAWLNGAQVLEGDNFHQIYAATVTGTVKPGEQPPFPRPPVRPPALSTAFTPKANS
jgi:hypothetical protein